MSEKVWIVYDGRASGGDTEDAAVLVSCQSLREARQYVREDFTNGCIFEYDLVGEHGKQEAINERMVS
jgi:hypothetical protein